MKTLEEIIREKFENRRQMLCDGINNLRKATEGMQACVDMEALAGVDVSDGYPIGLPVKAMQDLVADLRGHELGLDARLDVHTGGHFAINDEKNYQDAIDLLKDEYKKQEHDLRSSLFLTARTAYRRASIETKLDELTVLEMTLSDAQAEYDDYLRENGIGVDAVDGDDDEQEEE